jgi:hypothetical protein
MRPNAKHERLVQKMERVKEAAQAQRSALLRQSLCAALALIGAKTMADRDPTWAKLIAGLEAEVVGINERLATAEQICSLMERHA